MVSGCFCASVQRISGEVIRAAAAWAVLTLLASVTGAQVDPSGSWRSWQTEHFHIHAKTRLSSIVPVAAREAERAYVLLAGELVAPRGPIDLVLADNVDAANGFASPHPSNRVTVYLTPPTGAVSLRDYDSWLRLVITHELFHIFHLDQAKGVWGGLQTVFGRAPALFPNAHQPGWVTEGLATYYESRFTNAGRVRGAFHPQLLAAAAGEEKWPHAGGVTFASPAWPAGFGPYAWGAQFFALQTALHGDTVVPEFVERTSRQLLPFAVSAPLKGAGGQGVVEGWRRLRQRSRNAAGGRARVVLERGLRSEPHPRISADGEFLAFVRNDGKTPPRVVVRSLSADRVVASRRVNGAPDIAWVGDTLIVAQLEFVSPVDVRSDLYSWLPGGAWQRLTERARLTHPFAAPGGLVGAVDIGAGARSVVTMGNPGEMTRFATPPATGWGRLATSPDQSWVAGSRHHQARWDIVVWPSDDPAATRSVTDDRAVDEDPFWSPDGSALLFASARAGIPQIYAYRLDDGRLDRLTDEATGASEPTISVDGSLIYSTVFADGFAVVQRSTTSPVPGPVPEESPPAFVEAAPVHLDSGGYRPWHALRPRFWIPLGHDEGRSGTFYGASTGATDPIGRTRYAAAAAASPDPLRAEALLSVEHSRWKGASVDVAVSQSWDELLAPDASGALMLLGERERRAEAGLNLRWRRWRSGVSARLSAEIEQSSLFDDRAGGTLLYSSPAFAVGAVALRVAYVQRPALAISRENGVVLDGLLRRRWALSGADWSYELRGGARGYLALPLPGFARWVAAGRVAAGRTGGAAPEVFSIGGESSELFEIVPGFALGSGRRAFPLRGYPRAGAFTRAFVGVVELRIPILLIGKVIWRLPLALDRISLAAFGEVGGGWDEQSSPSLARYRDIGGEAVLDIGVGPDLPLRVRLGGALPLRDGLGVERGEARFYLAFGSAF